MTTFPAPVPPVPPIAAPGLVKTLGWLNVAFGGLLMLCVSGFDAYLLLLPYGKEKLGDMQKAAHTQRRERRDAELRALREQEAKAETPEDKARIRAEAIVLESTPLDDAPPPMADLSFLGLNEPRVKLHYAIDGITALVMNMFMVIAGIGLIRLRAWGRRLALWVAAIKILRLVLIGASMILVVQPVTNAKMLQADEPGAKPVPDGASNSLRWVSALTTLIYLSVGAAYPIILLVLLSQPGARAAVENPIKSRAV
jgi:hypothetical protein